MTVWYAIPEFEGYRISHSADILSMKQGDPKVMKTWISEGYRRVMLRRNGQYVNCKIAVLLLTTFVGPRPEGLEACHDDGNSTNDTLSNLYWGTSLQNNHDQARHGTHAESRRTECDRGHAFTEDNVYWRKGKDGRTLYRKCKRCQLDATKRWRESKKARTSGTGESDLEDRTLSSQSSTAGSL